MGGNNIFSALLNSIKARFTPFITRIRMFFTWSFLQARIVSRIRIFFQSIFNVKPRHKKDYYTFGRWMVSKRLCFAIVIVSGTLALIYIYFAHINQYIQTQDHSIKTYSYNSVLLKFAKGTVRIKGKSGYLAYEGDVKSGACEGPGKLFNPQGTMVYDGNFLNSKYEELGRRYYDDGTLWYNGNFHENLFSGEGKLYRKNASLEYTGEFLMNMKEGEGTLYDDSHNTLFSGRFTHDEIMYSDLLGKTASEMAEAYRGKMTMYGTSEERVRYMPDIDALTVEYGDPESVDAEYSVDMVYVLKDEFRVGNGIINSVTGLTQVLGTPTYEGTGRAILGELLAINKLNEKSDAVVLNGPAEIELNKVYTEYEEVESYQQDYEVYLHSYLRDGLIYTFVGEQGSDNFAFYYIIRQDLADVEN